jgi:flagellar biosynthesis protein FliR
VWLELLSHDWQHFVGLMLHVSLRFVRLIGAFALLPLYAIQPFPPQLSRALPIAGLPLLLYCSWGGVWPGTLPAIEFDLWFVLSVAAEFAIGVLISLPVGVLFWAAVSAGELIDTQTGANNNAVFNPSMATPEGPSGAVMSQLVALGFVSAGGLQLMYMSAARSFTAMPVGDYGRINLAALVTLAEQILSSMTALAVELFAPLLGLFFIIQLTVALVGKLASQLHLDTVSAPLKALVLPLALLVLLQLPQYLGEPLSLSLERLQSTTWTWIKP